VVVGGGLVIRESMSSTETECKKLLMECREAFARQEMRFVGQLVRARSDVEGGGEEYLPTVGKVVRCTLELRGVYDRAIKSYIMGDDVGLEEAWEAGVAWFGQVRDTYTSCAELELFRDICVPIIDGSRVDVLIRTLHGHLKTCAVEDVVFVTPDEIQALLLRVLANL
jgi:hypothetical protein